MERLDEAHLQWPAWIDMCYYTTSCHLLCSQYSVLVDLIMQYSTFSPFPLLNIFILLHNLVQHDTRVFYSHCHCLIFSCWIVFKLWVTPVLTAYSSFKNNQYSAHAWGKMCCCVTWNVLHSGLNQTAWRTSVFCILNTYCLKTTVMLLIFLMFFKYALNSLSSLSHTQAHTHSLKHNDRWDLTVHFACHARWGWPFKTTGKEGTRRREGGRKEGEIKKE